MRTKAVGSKGRTASGVPGVDGILGGGSLPKSATLVRWPPGSGTSIFSLHFPSNGIGAGDDTLYIDLGEPEDYIRDTARQSDSDIDTLEFLDLSASGDQFHDEEAYTLFESGETETPSLVRNPPGGGARGEGSEQCRSCGQTTATPDR